MFQDQKMYRGSLDIVLYDKDGNPKMHQTANNLVVDSGLAFVAARMVGTTPAVMSHMAVGTGVTAPAAGNTALQTELARVALSSGTASANVVTYISTFPAGTGTGAITEAGILNNPVGGDMLCRTTFAVVNKGADDSMTITWTVASEPAA